MKQVLPLVLAPFFLQIPVAAQALRRVRIDSPVARELAREFEQEGFDVLEGAVREDSLELVVSDPSMTRLLSMGYMPIVLEVGRPFEQIQAERDSAAGADAVPAGYMNLAAIYADMQATAAAFPAICQYVDLTQTYGTPPTWEGRHLFALKISGNVGTDEDEPAVLVVAAHHAREITTPVAVLYAVDQLTANYGSDPTVTQLVDSNEIWFAPVWNPDGYEYVFNTNNLWRKNRHVFGGGVGVDQNRNYPFGWSSSCAGSTNVQADDYKGPSAGSEAETMTMMAWSQAERFAKVIDYHSFGREVLYEYACLNHPLLSFLAAEATVLSQMSSYGGTTRAPSANGEHFEWQLATFSNHAFLIEIDTAFQPSFAQAQNEAARLYPGLLWMLGRFISVTGRVTDYETGLPVSATITYKGLAFQNGETNTSDPDTGRYHAFLPNGQQTLTFSAPGYITQSIAAYVVSTGPNAIDVGLHPVGICPTAAVFTRTQGANFNTYTATLPKLGQQVNFTVDTQGYQFATIFGVSSPGNRPVGSFWGLIDVNSPILFQFPLLPGPVAQASATLPLSPSLCGMIAYSQARLDTMGQPFGLTNALDLLAGN
jgi:hypothetical protein